MTPADWMRLAIIIASSVVACLWIYIGTQTHRWLLPLIASLWLVPVAIFFIVRFLFVNIPPTTLNIISLALYLMGVAAWGGMALARLKSLAERIDE
jgi:hypothetical protein